MTTMDCKKCLHYEMCLNKFRRAKEEGLWELTDEEEYFGHADDCDMFITGYCKASDLLEEIEESLHNIARLYLNCDLKDNFGICYSIYEEAVLPIKKKYTEGRE